ncbi:polymerase delta-interacting protein 2 isoform X2 [Monodelphis domestica]|uniref:polymerase delta-interacting protein 2 isoform X2 n=1 Tax=Monodelphis domestica TaxID=13616 RepID=UPI0007B41A4F|nr:polymerase delta-interacting protein 2 isoform X2 [Monodelphis domestica]
MAGCVARRALAVGSRCCCWWSRPLVAARALRPLATFPPATPVAATARRHLSSRNRPEGKVLETVGVFEVPKQNGKYETGQLFLHSIFGYRGVVLFPWQARLYDRDVASTAPEKTENPAGHGSKEVKGKTHTYYQVLIDARDCPHISQRSQTEAVTFLANHDDSRALYAIPGLDYVSHEDILPYTSTDQVPIQHELFERFLLYEQSKGEESPLAGAVRCPPGNYREHPCHCHPLLHGHEGGPEFPCLLVALLYPFGKLGQRCSSASGTSLEDIQPVRHAGNSAWPRCGRQGACLIQRTASFPV